MNYSKDMLLESQSGFMMPFASTDDEEVEVMLGFGEQRHPVTGNTFTHRGVDFVCPNKPLFALATGTVVGVGTDAIHENYIITKYGKYEVKYGHLSEAYVGYGKGVLAAQHIAQSGEFLHFEVSFAGQPLDPMEFLGMIYGNILQLQAAGLKEGNVFANMGVTVKTDYDKDQEEIEQMMQRWLGSYMQDIMLGNYTPPKRMETSLRNLFAQSSDKHYFYEAMPSIGNPLGLSNRGAPLAARFQNLLIGDFLNYMALRHNIFLSTWDDDQKKKVSEQAAADGFLVDPLENFQLGDVQSYDVSRTAAIYADNSGYRWWTKAWFNGREKGEKAIEIPKAMAVKFVHDEISKDAWLSRFYPKQMSEVSNAISKTRQQLLGL